MGDGARAAAEAFGRLADPVRVEILTALWERGRRDAVPFSDLKAAVGLRDSGRFNYHLGKLTGNFVEKTERGYRLRPAGLLVVDAVEAGAFTDDPALGPLPTDTPCPTCGAELAARYRDGEFLVDCPECETVVTVLVFPPRGVTERDPADVPAAYSERARRMFSMAAAGVCPFCGGRMATGMVEDEEGGPHHLSVYARNHCRECDGVITAAPGLQFLDDPGAVAFLHDHGVHVADRPFWELPFCRSDEGVAVASRDPLRVEVPYAVDGDELRLTVDGDAAVRERIRVTRE